MKQTPKINILLSTYNGEAYLTEQLDSLFQQTFQNFTLYVRDDASSDQTVELLHSYQKTHPETASRIILLPNPEHKNLGYMGSFWVLLQECGHADYYAFCDQDDVWLPDKLESGICCLEKENNSIPLLYFSNYHYCDQNLNVLHEAPTVSLPITFKDVLFYTPAFGFSIMINNCLRDMALMPSDHTELPHDGWVQKIAAAFGKIIYNPECTALYRRHSAAVTSSNVELLSMIKYWIKNDLFGSTMQDTHFVLTRFLQEYGTMLSASDHRLLLLYAQTRCSALTWIKRFLYPQKLRPTKGGDLALRICLFFNRY